MLLLHLRRWYWRQRCTHPAMRALLDQPVPARRTPFRQQRFVVLDLETSSLNPNLGEIVSLAWVVIEHGRIQLQQAQHIRLQLQRGVGQSAIYHQLTDTELAQGMAFEAALPLLLNAVQGSVLVFHNAALDTGFLNRYLRQHCGAPLLQPVLDTLHLEHASLRRQQAIIASGDLRLSACRQRHGLPPLPAHDALTDALATAELLLSQLSR